MIHFDTPWYSPLHWVTLLDMVLSS